VLWFILKKNVSAPICLKFNPLPIYPCCKLQQGSCAKLLWISILDADAFALSAATRKVCGDMYYAKIPASLEIKNNISLTPRNCDLNAFTFSLNDSAEAFVERLSLIMSLSSWHQRYKD
jgi:hypothetical protein